MGRTILTEVAIKRLKPPATGRAVQWDAALPGFGIRVTPNGRRSFVLVGRLRQRPVLLTLGAWPGVSLAAARDSAREAIQALARGEDPRRRKRAAVDSVEAVAASFIELYSKPKKRSWREDERLLKKHVTPKWGDRRLGELTRSDVVALTDGIAKRTPIQANRVLAVLKRLFRWALDRDLIAAHPAVGLTPPGAERARDRVLKDAELRKLWAAWTTQGYPWGLAFKVLALTACRRGEVEAMEWDEIDEAERIWTIPGERMKGKRAFVVPLSGAAVDLLKVTPRAGDSRFVFTTTEKGPVRDWSGAVERATALSGVTDWSAHDLRRTARTNLSRLGVPADIAERVLGHAMPGVRAVYDRHDFLAEKREALELWAAHLAEVVKIDG